MELEERVKGLEAEKAQALSTIETIAAEKIALDQMLQKSIQETFLVRKDMAIMNANLMTANNEVTRLMGLIDEKNRIT